MDSGAGGGCGSAAACGRRTGGFVPDEHFPFARGRDRASGTFAGTSQLPRPEEFEASLNERKPVEHGRIGAASGFVEERRAGRQSGGVGGFGGKPGASRGAGDGKRKVETGGGLRGKYEARTGSRGTNWWNLSVGSPCQMRRTGRNRSSNYGPELPNNPGYEEQERIAGEILAHLETGGKLGSFTLFIA